MIPGPVYRCTACAARWEYAEVRHVARCKHCGAGLTRADVDEVPRPGLVTARTLPVVGKPTSGPEVAVM